MSAGSYSDLLRALGQNESGNNYSFVSSVGYLGRFQFGEEALQAIGFYQGDGTHAIDFVGGWTAKAHAYGVYDKSSFLASPAAQDAAQQAWFVKVHEDLQALDLLKYQGQWVAGGQVTASGLLAGAHLVGVWNLKSWLETGGAHDTRDPYGTPVSQYVHKFAGYDTPFHGTGTTPAEPPAPPAPPAPPPPAASGELRGGAGDEALTGGAGADSIFGGAGADTLAGGEGRNYLRGEEGFDSLQGGGDFDDLHGNMGNDTVSGGGGDDWVVGGKDEDLLFGDWGHDVVLGNMGQDTCDGGAGNDVVRGGQGDDVVRGGEGDDWLAGDRGTDTVTGGAGADTFHFFADAGIDRVTDFNVWEGDRVDILDGQPYAVRQEGGDTVIDMGGGNQMILQGVQLSSLPEGWIF